MLRTVALILVVGASACEKSKTTENPEPPPAPTFDAMREVTASDAAPPTPAPSDAAPVPDAAPGRDANTRGTGSITADPKWLTCTKASECTRYFSGCSHSRVIVNSKWEAEVRAAYEIACDGLEPLSILTAVETFECRRNRCRGASESTLFDDMKGMRLDDPEDASE